VARFDFTRSRNHVITYRFEKRGQHLSGLPANVLIQPRSDVTSLRIDLRDIRAVFAGDEWESGCRVDDGAGAYGKKELAGCSGFGGALHGADGQHFAKPHNVRPEEAAAQRANSSLARFYGLQFVFRGRSFAVNAV